MRGRSYRKGGLVLLLGVFLQAGGQMTWPNLMGSNSALCSMAVRKCPPLLDFAVAVGCRTHDDVSSRIGCPGSQSAPLVACILLVASSAPDQHSAALKNFHAAPDAGCGSCFPSRA